MNNGDSILLFDGVCNLCNASVQFILKYDKHERIKLASLQSDIGQELLAKAELPTAEFTSLVFIQNNHYYTKSSAALSVLKTIGGVWQLCYVFILVPTFIRDVVYSTISRYRYSLFGKRDSCMLPSKNTAHRFLE